MTATFLKPLAVFGSFCLFLMNIAFAGEVHLTIDQAHTFSLKKPVGSMVVGNPSIADVTVRSNTELLMFGKMPGLTNIYFFDREGGLIDNVKVVVQNPRSNTVTLQSGSQRYTFVCTDVCEQSFTIGDGANNTRLQPTPIAQQATQKFQLATQAAGGSAAALSTNSLSSDGDVTQGQGQVQGNTEPEG
ncbi:MAG: pilus assembly protein N-terminal domain-containing protein [Pseudomonadota bacterium]